jgi:hypothetical protein
VESICAEQWSVINTVTKGRDKRLPSEIPGHYRAGLNAAGF